jgi:curved DNA-binding protein CbpA
MDHVRKAFGESADLYEALGLKDRDEAENPAKLRKAYFRKALLYHPVS